MKQRMLPIFSKVERRGKRRYCPWEIVHFSSLIIRLRDCLVHGLHERWFPGSCRTPTQWPNCPASVRVYVLFAKTSLVVIQRRERHTQVDMHPPREKVKNGILLGEVFGKKKSRRALSLNPLFILSTEGYYPPKTENKTPTIFKELVRKSCVKVIFVCLRVGIGRATFV